MAKKIQEDTSFCGYNALRFLTENEAFGKRIEVTTSFVEEEKDGSFSSIWRIYDLGIELKHVFASQMPWQITIRTRNCPVCVYFGKFEDAINYLLTLKGSKFDERIASYSDRSTLHPNHGEETKVIFLSEIS